QLPAAEQGLIKLDAAKVGNTSIHQVTLKLSPKEQKVLGDGPVYFAISDEALLVVAGRDALGTLKAARETPAAPAHGIFYYEVTVGPLVALAAQKEHEKAAAKKAFASDPGLIRFSVEGGQKLQIRLNAAISILEFAVSVAEKAKEVKFPGSGE